MSPTELPAAAAANPEDASHLRILGIFYYIFAGLNLLSVVFVALFLTMAVLTSEPMPAVPAVPDSYTAASPPENFLMILVPLFVLAGLLSLLIGVLQFMTARRLRDRRGRTFCHVAAAVTCLSIPFGTVLGVFTFIVLARPSVKALFEGRR